MVVTYSDCQNWPNGQGFPKGSCYALNSDGIEALYSDQPLQTLQNSNIQCTFAVNGSAGQDTTVAFGFENNDDLDTYGGNILHISPWTLSWVNLKKRIVSLNGKGADAWEAQLQYHSLPNSNGATGGTFDVTVHIRDFVVDHYDQKDNYNGWQALGSIGGFAFFLVILHTLVMLLVGIFLDNNSRFLNDEISPYSAPDRTTTL